MRSIPTVGIYPLPACDWFPLQVYIPSPHVFVIVIFCPPENTLEALRQITLDEQARVVDDVPMTSGKSSDLNENFNTRYIATTAVKAATPSFHSGFSAVLKRSMSFFDLQIRRAHDSWGDKFVVLRRAPLASSSVV